MELSKKYLGDFGIAAPCGFGRTPERPGSLLSSKDPKPAEAILKNIVEDHVGAVKLLREVQGG